MSNPEINSKLAKDNSHDKLLNFLSQTTFCPNQPLQGIHPLLLNENSTDRTIDNNTQVNHS